MFKPTPVVGIARQAPLPPLLRCLLFCIFFLSGHLSFADDVPVAEDYHFKTTDFSTSQSASIAGDADFWLTPDQSNADGRVNSNIRIDFAYDFSLETHVNLGANNSNGGDGLSLLFHNDPAGENLSSSVTLHGSGNTQNGIAILIDTFKNTDENEIGVDFIQMLDTDNATSDNAITSAGVLNQGIATGNIEDGVTRKLVVDWSAVNQTLTATLFDNTTDTTGTVISSLSEDIVNNRFAGQSKVFLGAGADTSTRTNVHRVKFVTAQGVLYNAEDLQLPLADDTGSDPEPAIPNTVNFNTTDFSTSQSASIAGDADFWLTSDQNNVDGRINSNIRIDFAYDFSLETHVNLGANNSDGGDGLSLLFHNDPAGENLSSSVTLHGSGNTQNGIAILIDTFNNTDENETGVDFIQMLDTDTATSDNAITSAGVLNQGIATGNIEDGITRKLVVDWSIETQTLTATLFDNTTDTTGIVISSLSEDIVNNRFASQSKVYIGAGADTSTRTNVHRVRFVTAQGVLYNAEDLQLPLTDDTGTNSESVTPYDLSFNSTDFTTSQSASSTGNANFRLTPDQSNVNGRVNSNIRIDFAHNFSLETQVNLGSNDSDGGNGLSLLFHNDPAGKNLSSSVTLHGSGNTQNGIAILFDTFRNLDENEIGVDFFQILDTDTATSDNAITSVGVLNQGSATGNIEDGAARKVVVDWNATDQTLTVTLFKDTTTHAEVKKVTSLSEDIVNNRFAGQSKVFFGAGADTGSRTNMHQVRFVTAHGVLYGEGGEQLRNPIARSPTVSVFPGETVVLDASGSSAHEGAQISHYSWFFYDSAAGTPYFGQEPQLEFIAPELAENSSAQQMLAELHVSDNNSRHTSTRVGVLLKAADTCSAGLFPPDLTIGWINNSGDVFDWYNKSLTAEFVDYPYAASYSDGAGNADITFADECSFSGNYYPTDINADAYSISGTCLNLAPEIVTPAGAMEADEGTQVTLSVDVFDEDAIPACYSWSQVGDGAFVDLQGADTANPTFTAFQVADAEVEELQFEVIVTDSSGEQSLPAVVAVNVNDVNIHPVAEISPINEFGEGTTVVLNASGSSDNGGSIAEYTWSQITGPAVTLGSTPNPIFTFSAPEINAASDTIELQLVVTDNQGLSSTPEFVTLTVNNVLDSNDPTAIAGQGQSVFPGDAVMLDGSQSSAASQQITSYHWRQVWGPPVSESLTDLDTAQPAFTAPALSNDYAKLLVFELTVEDTFGRTSERSYTQVLVKGPDTCSSGAFPPDLTHTWQTNKGDITWLNDFFDQNPGDFDEANSTELYNPLFFEYNDGQTGDLVFSGCEFNGSYFDNDSSGQWTGSCVSEPPQIAAFDLLEIDEGEQISLQAIVSDADSAPSCYHWTQVSGPTVELQGADTGAPTFTALEAPDHGVIDLQFALTVTDNTGKVSEPGLFDVRINDTNLTPLANLAVVDNNVDEGQLLVLDAAASTDPDGTIVEYRWSQISGPSLNMDAPDSPQFSFTTPDVNLAGATIIMQLVVVDNVGALSDPISVEIQINDTNVAPVASVSAPASVDERTTIVFDATASTDTDGSIAQYHWQQLSGPDINIDSANDSTFTFTVPEVGLTGDNIVVELGVTDNEGLPGETQQFAVMVSNKNLAPTAQITGADSINEGQELTVTATSSNDIDGEVSEYLWTQISGPDININNISAPNFTVTTPLVPSSGAVIVIELKVTDNQGLESAPLQKQFAITNVNHKPVAVIDTVASVAEGIEVTFDATAASDEDGNIVQYSWSQLSGPDINIDGVAAATFTFSAPEVTENETIIVQLLVTDNDGDSSAPVNAVVLVENVNRSPVAALSAVDDIDEGSNVVIDATASSDEDGTVAQYHWTQLSGPDINIESVNEATFSFTAPEVEPVGDDIVVQLKVTDNGGLESEPLQTTITVNNVNAAPLVQSGRVQARFNERSDISVYITDKDDNINSIIWNQISGRDLQLADADTFLPSVLLPETGDEGELFILQVTVTDAEGLSTTEQIEVAGIWNRSESELQALAAATNILGLSSTSIGDIEQISANVTRLASPAIPWSIYVFNEAHTHIALIPNEASGNLLGDMVPSLESVLQGTGLDHFLLWYAGGEETVDVSALSDHSDLFSFFVNDNGELPVVNGVSHFSTFALGGGVLGDIATALIGDSDDSDTMVLSGVHHNSILASAMGTNPADVTQGSATGEGIEYSLQMQFAAVTPEPFDASAPSEQTHVQYGETTLQLSKANTGELRVRAERDTMVTLFSEQATIDTEMVVSLLDGELSDITLNGETAVEWNNFVGINVPGFAISSLSLNGSLQSNPSDGSNADETESFALGLGITASLFDQVDIPLQLAFGVEQGALTTLTMNFPSPDLPGVPEFDLIAALGSGASAALEFLQLDDLGLNIDLSSLGYRFGGIAEWTERGLTGGFTLVATDTGYTALLRLKNLSLGQLNDNFPQSESGFGIDAALVSFSSNDTAISLAQLPTEFSELLQQWVIDSDNATLNVRAGVEFHTRIDSAGANLLLANAAATLGGATVLDGDLTISGLIDNVAFASVELKASLPSLSLTPGAVPLSLSNISLGGYFTGDQSPEYYARADASWRDGSLQGQAGLINRAGNTTTILRVENLSFNNLMTDAVLPEPLASFTIEQAVFGFADTDHVLSPDDVPAPLQELLGEGNLQQQGAFLTGNGLQGTSFRAQINSGQLSTLMAGALSLDESLAVSSEVILTGVYSEGDAQVQSLDLQVALPGESVTLARLPALNNVVLQSHSRSDQTEIDYSITGDVNWQGVEATAALTLNNAEPTVFLQLDEITLGQLVDSIPSPFAELGVQDGLLIFSQYGGTLSAEDLPQTIATLLADNTETSSDLAISAGVTLKARVGSDQVQSVIDTTVTDLGVNFSADGSLQLGMTAAIEATGTIELALALPGMALPDIGVALADDIAITGAELIVEIDTQAPGNFEVSITTDASWPSRGINGSLAVFRSDNKVGLLLQSKEILLTDLLGAIPGLEDKVVPSGSILISPADFTLPDTLPTSVSLLRGDIPSGLYDGVQFSAAIDPDTIVDLLGQVGIDSDTVQLQGTLALTALLTDDGSKLDIELPGFGNLLQDIPLADEIVINSTLLGIDTRQATDAETGAAYYVTGMVTFRDAHGSAMIVTEAGVRVLLLNVQNLSLPSLLGDIPAPFNTLVLPRAIIGFATDTLADDYQLPGPIGEMLRAYQPPGVNGIKEGVTIFSELDTQFAESLYADSLSAIGAESLALEVDGNLLLRATLDTTPGQKRADVMVSAPTLNGPGGTQLLSDLRLSEMELGVTVSEQSPLEYFASGTAHWDEKDIVGHLGVMHKDDATVAVVQVENLSLSTFVDDLPDNFNAEFPDAPLVFVSGDFPLIELNRLGQTMSGLLAGSVNAAGQLQLPEGLSFYTSATTTQIDSLMGGAFDLVGLNLADLGLSGAVSLSGSISGQASEPTVDITVALPTVDLSGSGLAVLEPLTVSGLEFGVSYTGDNKDYYVTGDATWAERGISGSLGLVSVDDKTVALLRSEAVSFNDLLGDAPAPLNTVSLPTAVIALASANAGDIQLNDLAPPIQAIFDGVVFGDEMPISNGITLLSALDASSATSLFSSALAPLNLNANVLDTGQPLLLKAALGGLGENATTVSLGLQLPPVNVPGFDLPIVNEMQINNVELGVAADLSNKKSSFYATAAGYWPARNVTAEVLFSAIDGEPLIVMRANEADSDKLSLGTLIYGLPAPLNELSVPAPVLVITPAEIKSVSPSLLPPPLLSMLGDAIDDEVSFAQGISIAAELDFANLPPLMSDALGVLGIDRNVIASMGVLGPVILEGSIGLYEPNVSLKVTLPSMRVPDLGPLEEIVNFDDSEGYFFISTSKAGPQVGLGGNMILTMPRMDGSAADNIEVSGDLFVSMAGPPAVAITAALNGTWNEPFGLRGFAFSDSLLQLDASGAAGVSISHVSDISYSSGGKSQQFTGAGNIGMSRIPVVDKFAVYFDGDELSALTMVDMADGLIRGAAASPGISAAVNELLPAEVGDVLIAVQDRMGNESLLDMMQVDLSVLDILKLEDFEFYYATPGAALPRDDLNIGMGVVVKGKTRLTMQGSTHTLAQSDTRITLEDGLQIKGALGNVNLGPLSLRSTEVDIGFGIPLVHDVVPHFNIAGGARLWNTGFDVDAELSQNPSLAMTAVLAGQQASFTLDPGSIEKFITEGGDLTVSLPALSTDALRPMVCNAVEDAVYKVVKLEERIRHQLGGVVLQGFDDIKGFGKDAEELFNVAHYESTKAARNYAKKEATKALKEAKRELKKAYNKLKKVGGVFKGGWNAITSSDDPYSVYPGASRVRTVQLFGALVDAVNAVKRAAEAAWRAARALIKSTMSELNKVRNFFKKMERALNDAANQLAKAAKDLNKSLNNAANWVEKNTTATLNEIDNLQSQITSKIALIGSLNELADDLGSVCATGGSDLFALSKIQLHPFSLNGALDGSSDIKLDLGMRILGDEQSAAINLSSLNPGQIIGDITSEVGSIFTNPAQLFDDPQTSNDPLLLSDAPIPVNDNFSDAAVLLADSSQVFTSNIGATMEPGEPLHGGTIADQSLWWAIDPQFDLTLSINTIGSDFDTLLAIYTGDAVDDLTLVARNDQSAVAHAAVELARAATADATENPEADSQLLNNQPLDPGSSELIVHLQAGTRYHIAVAGWYTQAGELQLNVEPVEVITPDNDQIELARTWYGELDSVDSTYATTNLDEPLPSPGEGSVWWLWIADQSKVMSLNSAQSAVDLQTGVYRKDSQQQWQLVTFNGDARNNDVVFEAEAGVEYLIGAGHRDHGGELTLAMNPVDTILAANDELENASLLEGWSNDIYANNTLATLQRNEAGERYPGTNSLWWKWQAPEDGVLSLDTGESSVTTRVDVFQGQDIENLQHISGAEQHPATNPDTPSQALELPVIQGEVHWIRLASAVATGELSLRSSRVIPKYWFDNDNQTVAPWLTDLGESFTVDMALASRNEAESEIEGSGGVVWWRALLQPGTELQLTADATDDGSPITLLAYDEQNPEPIAFSTPHEGSTRLRVSSKNGEPIWLAVVDTVNSDSHHLLSWQTSLLPIPENDLFASAMVLTSANGKLNGSTTFADVELDEPTVATATVWYRFTAATSGWMEFSGHAGELSQITAYRGSQQSNLTEVAKISLATDDQVSTNDSQGNDQNVTEFNNSSISLNVEATESIWLAVGALFDTADFTLQWNTVDAPAASNDDFENASPLTTNQTVTVSNLYAANQADEPLHGFSNARSLWWSWQATNDGLMSLTAQSADFPVALGVYAGNALTELRVVSAGESQGEITELQFNAQQGQHYRIAIGSENGAGGDIELLLQNADGEAPANDLFENAIVFDGTSVNVSVDTRLASRQFDEPQDPQSNASGNVWYYWQAPADGALNMAVQGDKIPASLAVFKQVDGSRVHLGTVSQSEADEDITTDASVLRDYVTTGDEFWFAVSGARGHNGQASFGLQFNEQFTAPRNDLFATRTVISGNEGETVLLVDLAGFENGEPQAAHWVDTAAGSVWWSYTAERDGWLRINPIYETNVGIGVYQGDAVDQLTVVDMNQQPVKEKSLSEEAALEEGLTVEVLAGQTYAIAMIVPWGSTPGFQADFEYELLTAPEVYPTEDHIVTEGDSIYVAAADTIEGYQYQWTVAPDNIVFSPVGGGVSFIAPEVDAKGQAYEFTLHVTNDNDITSTTVIQVLIQNKDRQPIAVAGVDARFSSAAVVDINGEQSFDPDGTELSAIWSQSYGDAAEIAQPSALATTALPSSQRGIQLQLQVTDSAGQSSIDTVIFNPQGSNRIPQADAGPAQTVVVGEQVVLGLGNSSDRDGSIDNAYWRQLSGTEVALIPGSNGSTSFVVPQPPESFETLLFELLVEDNHGALHSARKMIHISNGQSAPVVVMPLVLIAEAGEEVILNASSSYDPDGDEIRYYHWKALTGNKAPQPVTADAAISSVVLPSNSGQWFYEASIENSKGLRSSAVVMVSSADVPVPDTVVTNIAAQTGAPVGLLLADAEPQNSATAELTIAEHSWRQTSGNALAFDPFASSPALTAETGNNSKLLHTSTFADGMQTQNTVILNVLSEDQTAPAMLENFSIDTQTGSTVRLSAAAAETDWIHYEWRQVAGESVVLSDTDMPGTSFVIPAAQEQQMPGEYQFELTARNATGHASIAKINVYAEVVSNQLFGSDYHEVTMDSPGTPLIGVQHEIRGEHYLVAVEAIDSATMDELLQNPAAPTLSNGLFRINTRMFAPGAVEHKIKLPEPALEGQSFWVYNPLSQQWLTSPTINWVFNEDRSEVTVEIVDNDAADGDSTRNAISIIGGLSSMSVPEIAAAQGEKHTFFSGHCFIATAVYEEDQEKLQLLRQFRDQILLPTSPGESFVRSYYRYSPPIANWLRDNHWAQTPVRVVMLPVVGMAWIALQITVVHLLFGLLAILLLIRFIRVRAGVSSGLCGKLVNKLFTATVVRARRKNAGIAVPTSSFF